uniref:Uncharacterized protein n=1 Tax=Kalanchoe fedtschenkoi TaxID=63787 RepID=A0A7N0TA12_KALFE
MEYASCLCFIFTVWSSLSIGFSHVYLHLMWIIFSWLQLRRFFYSIYQLYVHCKDYIGSINCRSLSMDVNETELSYIFRV